VVEVFCVAAPPPASSAAGAARAAVTASPGAAAAPVGGWRAAVACGPGAGAAFPAGPGAGVGPVSAAREAAPAAEASVPAVAAPGRARRAVPVSENAPVARGAGFAPAGAAPGGAPAARAGAARAARPAACGPSPGAPVRQRVHRARRALAVFRLFGRGVVFVALPHARAPAMTVWIRTGWLRRAGAAAPPDGAPPRPGRECL